MACLTDWTDGTDGIDGTDRKTWHLNLTFQDTCLGQLLQFLQCFYHDDTLTIVSITYHCQCSVNNDDNGFVISYSGPHLWWLFLAFLCWALLAIFYLPLSLYLPRRLQVVKKTLSWLIKQIQRSKFANFWWHCTLSSWGRWCLWLHWQVEVKILCENLCLNISPIYILSTACLEFNEVH